MIDTGASITCLSPADYAHLETPLTDYGNPITTTFANGEDVQLQPVACAFEFDGITVNRRVISVAQSLLGLDQLDYYDLHVLGRGGQVTMTYHP